MKIKQLQRSYKCLWHMLHCQIKLTNKKTPKKLNKQIKQKNSSHWILPCTYSAKQDGPQELLLLVEFCFSFYRQTNLRPKLNSSPKILEKGFFFCLFNCLQHFPYSHWTNFFLDFFLSIFKYIYRIQMQSYYRPLYIVKVR